MHPLSPMGTWALLAHLAAQRLSAYPRGAAGIRLSVLDERRKNLGRLAEASRIAVQGHCDVRLTLEDYTHGELQVQTRQNTTLAWPMQNSDGQHKVPCRGQFTVETLIRFLNTLCPSHRASPLRFELPETTPGSSTAHG